MTENPTPAPPRGRPEDKFRAVQLPGVEAAQVPSLGLAEQPSFAHHTAYLVGKL